MAYTYIKNFIEMDGSVFNNHSDAIIHQVNCQSVMGSGVAKQIRERYPEVYKAYQNFSSSIKKEDLLGECLIVPTIDNKYVVNLFGQLDYGRDGKIYTNYEALRKALKSFKEQLPFLNHKFNKLQASVPYNMGCGLGGGDWSIVKEILIDTLGNDENIYVFICKFLNKK